MKKLIGLIMSLCLAASLAGCGASGSVGESKIPENEKRSETATADIGEDSTETTNGEETDQMAGDTDQMTGDTRNVLVAYFSLAGEQYNVGVIEEGNTAIVAKMIAEKTGADLFEIVPVNAYPTSHSELLDVAKKEQSDSARPEIKEKIENFDDYDVIYVGYPNWWGDMPMIVYNFLESYDWNGKTVIPFVTHGGSGFSGTRQTIADICSGATLVDGFSISGETAQKDREKTDSEVTEWLTGIGGL